MRDHLAKPSWDPDYVMSDFPSACQFAVANGLRCLEQQGTRRSLERLDRPAVLELREGDRQRFATLRRLEGPTAILLTAGGEVAVDFRMTLLRPPGPASSYGWGRG